MDSVSTENYQLELPYKSPSVSVYWKKITIPKGLPALLEMFVKESIRENPDDIYKFLANFTETLLAKRAEEQGVEPVAGNKQEKQADEESPLLDSQAPAIPISYQIENQKEAESQVNDEKVVVEETDVEAALAEEIQAASKIQAGFRGFKTRKQLREQKDDSKSESGVTSPTALSVPESESKLPEQTGQSTPPSSPTIVTEELIQKATAENSEISPSPSTESPNPDKEVNDEEIAAEIKTPLETIREESFEQSSSALGAPIASPIGDINTPVTQDEIIEESQTPVPQNENCPTSVEGNDVITDNEGDTDAKTPSNDADKEEDVTPNKKPGSATSQRSFIVHEMSMEEIAEALGDVLDDDDNTSESGEDPSVREKAVTKGTGSGSAMNHKNDESTNESSSTAGVETSSQEINDDGAIEKDEIRMEDEKLAEDQNGDHQTETGATSTQEEESVEALSPNDKQNATDGNVDDDDNIIGDSSQEENDNPESGTTTQESKADEDNVGETQNIPHVQQNNLEEDGPTVINLSSSANDTADTTNADQNPVCVDEEGNEVAGDDVDKNKKSNTDEDEVVPDGIQNIEKEEGNKNIRNVITTTTAPHLSATEQPEVGQPDKPETADDVVGGDLDKTGSIPVHGISAVSDSSVDREDTDIGTPTEYTIQEGRDSVNSESKTIPTENFEFEEHLENHLEVADESMETAASESMEQKQSIETASSPELTSSGEGQVIQVEIKPNEAPISPQPAENTEENKDPVEGAKEGESSSSPDATDKPVEPTVSENVPADVQQTENPTSDVQTTTPEVASGTTAEVANTQSASPSEADAVSKAPVEGQGEKSDSEISPVSTSPQATTEAEKTGTETAPQEGDEVKPAEPPVPILRPESENVTEAISPQPSESIASPTPSENVKSPEPNQPISDGLVPNESETTQSPIPDTEVPKTDSPPDVQASEGQDFIGASPAEVSSTSPAPASESNISPTPAAELSAPATPAPESSTLETPAPEEKPETPSASTPATPAPEETSSVSTPATPAPEEKPETPSVSIPATPAPEEKPETPAPATTPAPEEKSDSATATTPSPEEKVDSPPVTNPAPEEKVESTPVSTPAPEEKVESPPTTTPAPEEKPDSSPTQDPITPSKDTASPQPSTETVASPPPQPDSDPSLVTTNQPDASDIVLSTNSDSSPQPAAEGDNSDQVSPPADIKGAEKGISVQTESATENKATDSSLKQEKPAVRPRLNKQSSSVVKQESTQSVNEADLSSTAPTPPPVALSSQTASPVLRRPKSGSGRSRATTSKYRSGLVIEDQISMDDMEREIEEEMMNNAAIKIQAGFRGFKTRQSLSQYGVSKKSKSEDLSGADGVQDVDIAQADITSSCESVPVAARLTPERASSDSCVASNDADAIASRGCKPPLSFLRSRSYPGSHEEEAPGAGFDEGDEDHLLNVDPEIDLELDPEYINMAATRIQANFRGYRVRKSIKRPGDKENSGDEEESFKNQKLDSAETEAEERVKVMETHERLQSRDSSSPSVESDYIDVEDSSKAASKIQASFRSYKERQKFHQKKKAAITIQANIRGFLTRKRLANLRRRSFQRRRSSAKSFQKELEQVKTANDAATKIQAVFRGYQVRSKMPRSSSMINEHEQGIDN